MPFSPSLLLGILLAIVPDRSDLVDGREVTVSDSIWTTAPAGGSTGVGAMEAPRVAAWLSCQSGMEAGGMRWQAAPVARLAPTTKDEAEALAAAVEIGAATPAEIVAWADLLILASEKPDCAICEVSLMRNEPRPDIASTLRRIEGDTSSRLVRGLVVERLVKMHDDGLVTPERLAKWIYDDAMSDEAGWGEHCGGAMSFWDAIDLARLGHVGDYETCVAEMVSFLRLVAASLLQDDEALEEIEIAKALR